MFGTYAHYFYFCRGELAEWSIAAVLKTVDLSKGPRVRIPHSPQMYLQNTLKRFKLMFKAFFVCRLSSKSHILSHPEVPQLVPYLAVPVGTPRTLASY